jgi:hypothetical protein
MRLDFEECRVRTASGELIARGVVREHTASRATVEAKSYVGSWLAVGERAQLEVLTTDRGALTYDGIVDLAVARRIDLRDLRLREVVQQRAAVRVATHLAVRVHSRIDEDGEVQLDPPWTVVALDVSAHGARLLIERELVVGTRLGVVFDTGDTRVDLMTEVVRIEEIRGGFAYGCRFVDATERQHDLLFAYVLREQRATLARRAQQL